MKPLSDTKLKKQTIVKNFFLVAILSTGVSLVANAITYNAETCVALIPGIICILIVAFFYFKEYLGLSLTKINIKTVVCVDNEKRPIPIQRFRFSEDLCLAVTSVLTENKAYLPLWGKSFLVDKKVKDNKKFINEFLEYLFVNWFSLELNSYFSKFDKTVTEVIHREQIPDVLINNRVIELITKPYYERERFQKMVDKNTQNKDEVYMIKGEDNVLFRRLEIELPSKSKVVRDGNALVIKNRNFVIRFESIFDGFCFVLPSLFESYYLNRPIRDVNSYQVKLSLSVKLTPFFLLSKRDWKYLEWLDQLEEDFLTYFSFDEFAKRVGYEQAATEHFMFLNGFREQGGKTPASEHNHSIISIRKVELEEKKN